MVAKIEPSSYSSFKNGISIFSGNILAIGSESEPIIFTSAYDDTVGGDTDYYEDCYEPKDEEGNITGTEVCDRYDMGDPMVGDWGGIYVSESTGSVLKNVFIKYADEGLTLYKSKLTLEKMHLDEVDEALTLYETSEVLFSDLSLSNIYTYALSIFNDTSFIGNGLDISRMYTFQSAVVEVFNNSVFDIKNASFKDCTTACVSVFDGDDYTEKPSRVEIEDSVFEGGLESGLLTFSRSVIPMFIQIKNSVFKNFGSFAIENYTSTTTVQAKENDWNSSSGPYHETLNPDGQGEQIYGLVDFDPWIGKDQDLSPVQYYARITNIPSGVAYLYDEPNISASLVKTLPNDWVVRVVSKVGEDSNPMISGGYRWYKVEDPTDKTLHYMISGSGAKSIYLPYEEGKQVEYENISIDNLSGTTTFQKNKRRQAVLDALDHYYNDTSTEKSLYSSDDHASKISLLKNKKFSKDIIRAFIAVEIGGANFDNERVAGDYGHGMMQLTFKSYNDSRKNYDNRGIFSDVKNTLCKNFILINNVKFASNDYKKCYTPVYNSKNILYKQIYDHYEDFSTNPIYKNYSNTIQSIYSNIKDGLGLLSSKYGTVFPNNCKKDWVTESGLIITCEEISVIKTLWGYNGATVTSPDYLGKVSDYLKNLSTYFPGYTYSNSDKMIEKLAYAGKNRIEIKKHSPITISIKDSKNNITGEIENLIYSDIPYSEYSSESESVVIFFPDDNYTYKVVGDSNGGTYGLDINNYNGSDTPVSFNALDIPIIPGEIHTYTVDQSKLASDKPDAVTIQIDVNADGVPEKTIKVGDTLTSVTPYDFYFKKPVVSGGLYKVNKELPIKIKVVKEEKSKIKIPRPKFTITRISDGYVLPLKDRKVGEDDSEDEDDRRYYIKFLKKHNRNYTLKLPKNTLTEGEWKIEVNLGDVVRHSIIITMVK